MYILVDKTKIVNMDWCKSIFLENDEIKADLGNGSIVTLVSGVFFEDDAEAIIVDILGSLQDEVPVISIDEDGEIDPLYFEREDEAEDD